LFRYKTNICFKLKHLLHFPNKKPTQFASTHKTAQAAAKNNPDSLSGLKELAKPTQDKKKF
jgi:hypothetical protein